MEYKFGHISHLFYWLWFFWYLNYVLGEILMLKSVNVGEDALYMIFSTFAYLFAGIIIYLFTVTFDISGKYYSYARGFAFVVCIIFVVFFWLALKENSKLITRY